MKKKFHITLILVTGILAIFFIGKQLIKNDSPIKPTVDFTVYTRSADDTERWNQVRQVETVEAIYHIRVKEVESSEAIFSNLIEDGVAIGFGVSEDEVNQFNNNLGTTVEDSKNNKLIGMEFLTFSTGDEGIVFANFDYGKKEINDQKKGAEELYKKLYEAFKK
ncbi:hypothetical protein HO543_02590 [Streptococcus suis]|nr:hypothetical protein [Streptococcus suis]NQJ76255.1 hypothetical protein [Streptococcus suis]